MNDRPDLNLLVVFDAIARTGSVTLAAQRLSLSQPAVSHALNRFRDVTGDPLFVRNGNRLDPTRRAEAMIPAIRRILQDVGLVLAPSTFDPLTSKRTYRIGASDYAMMSFLPAIIRSVRAQAPHTRLDIQSMGEGTLARLSTGELDLAFVGGDVPNAPLKSRELFRERFIGLLCARHPIAIKAGQNAVTLDDYLAFPHVMVSFRDPRQSPIDQRLAEMGKERLIAVTTSNFASNIASIKDTDLIMSLPSRLAATASRGDLIQFRLPLHVPDYPYSMLWHPRTDQDQSTIWLRDIVGHIFHET